MGWFIWRRSRAALNPFDLVLLYRVAAEGLNTGNALQGPVFIFKVLRSITSLQGRDLLPGWTWRRALIHLLAAVLVSVSQATLLALSFKSTYFALVMHAFLPCKHP
jgi:hypothetical protein